jgi:phosphoribosylformylglycinamidine synthase
MTRVAVIRFPGSNCDADALRACCEAGADADYLWHREESLGNADVVVIPGGFAFGDHLRAGAIARFSPIMKAVIAHGKAGGPVLGICNGFQVLCESGMLPGALVGNANLRFLSRPLAVRIEAADTAFTNQYSRGEEFVMPVAHGDGRFVAPEELIDELESDGRVIFRYSADNPNGSMNSIAGITNAERNVVGLMPHPERAANPLLGETRGKKVFDSMMQNAGVLKEAI